MRIASLLSLAFALAPTAAIADDGDLTQLPGVDGCVSETGLAGTEACANGRGLRGSRSVTLSPDGRHGYAAAQFGGASLTGSITAGFGVGAVAAFDRDDDTGELNQLSDEDGCISETGMAPPLFPSETCVDGKGLDNASDVVVSPDGESAYVASQSSGGGAVAVFDRDPDSGKLTQLSGNDGCVSQTGLAGAGSPTETCTDGRGLTRAGSVRVSPDGENVYVAANGDSVAVFQRDDETGALTQLEGTAGCVSETGDGGECADGRALDHAFSVNVSPDEKNVYVASANSSAVAVFDRDDETGALTQLEGTAGCVSDTGNGGCADGRALNFAASVRVSRGGDHVYVASQFSNAVAIFDRDDDTGELNQLSGNDGCVSETGRSTPGDSSTSGECEDGKALAGAIGVDVSPDGENVYVVSLASAAVAVFARDSDSGKLEQLSDPDGCVSETGRSVPNDPETTEECDEGRALAGAQFVTVSPNPRNVYVAASSSGTGALGFFVRDLDEGALEGDGDDDEDDGGRDGGGNRTGDGDGDGDGGSGGGPGPFQPVFSAEAFAFAQCLSPDLAQSFGGIANLGRLGRCMAATVEALTGGATPGEACRRQRPSGVRGRKRRSDFSACFLAASRAVLARRLAGF